MSMRNFLAGVACAGLIAAGPAAGAAYDFYVQTEAFNADNGDAYQPFQITTDWLDGVPMIRPDGACGMLFTYSSEITSYPDDGGEGWTHNGPAEALLPSADCTSVNVVTFEIGAIQEAVADYVSGYVHTYNRGLWSDGNGHALAYLHQPCQPMPSCMEIMDDQVVANGWSDSLGDPLTKLRIASMEIKRKGTGALPQVMVAANVLEQTALTTAERVQNRRTVDTGPLEPSIRQVEDVAQRHISQARDRVSECARALGRGGIASASKACDEALRRVLDARAALDTGDAWFD
jgi:hypothetical protein